MVNVYTLNSAILVKNGAVAVSQDCCCNLCDATGLYFCMCIGTDPPTILFGPTDYQGEYLDGCTAEGCEATANVDAVCCSGEKVPDYPGFNPCECPPYTVWVPGTGPEDPGNCIDPGWNCIDGNCVAWDGNGDVEFPGYNDCITYCV